jgi:hypothetical protein
MDSVNRIRDASAGHIERAAKSRKAEVKSEKPGPAQPLDKVEKGREFTREERIRIALARSARSGASVMKTATGTYSGFVIGTALGFGLIGGLYGPVIGGLAGSIGALILEEASSKRKAQISDGLKHIGSSIRKSFQHTLKPESKVSGKTEGKKAGEARGPGEAVKTAADAREGSIVRQAGVPAAPEGTKNPVSGVFGVLKKAVTGVGKGMKALPKFLYPSIRNATAAERELIEKTLDRLPLKSVVSTESITMNPNLAKDMGASGLARNMFFMHPIDFDRGELAVEGFNKGTIIHEVGHTRDFSEGLIPYFGSSSKAPWGKPPYVYDHWIDTPNDLYASTNHWEDFAQSYKFYYENPAELEKTNPAKFEAIKNMEKPGLYDKVMDRTGIREAGKKLSQAIDKVPGLRLALDVVSEISGPLTIHRGSANIIKGLEDGDEKKLFDGKMDLASGIAYSSKVAAPAGLAIDGVHWYLNRAVKKGRISQERADEIASRTLKLATGPVGLTAGAAVDEMLGAKGQDLKGIRLVESRDKDPDPVSKWAWKKTLVLLAGTAAAGVVGAVAAGLMFGPGAVLIGSAVGSMVGARGTALLRNIFAKKPPADLIIDGKKVSGKEAALTRDDKIFMAKVGGGAAAGGVAGTVLGYAGGAAAGALLGGLIGGPIGAGVGAFLGKAAGSFALSYAGAKAGARLGKMLDKPQEKA